MVLSDKGLFEKKMVDYENLQPAASHNKKKKMWRNAKKCRRLVPSSWKLVFNPVLWLFPELQNVIFYTDKSLTLSYGFSVMRLFFNPFMRLFQPFELQPHLCSTTVSRVLLNVYTCLFKLKQPAKKEGQTVFCSHTDFYSGISKFSTNALILAVSSKKLRACP